MIDVVRLAYLARYFFILILGLSTFYLVKFAWRQLNSRLRLKSVPLAGYFIFYQPQGNEDTGIFPKQFTVRQRNKKFIYEFPLYPTTVIGRAKKCDLIFRSRTFNRNALTIYRYDGTWYIRKNGKQEILLNNQELKGATILQSRDKIKLADYEFTFVDERLETARAGLQYDENLAGQQSTNFKVKEEEAAPTAELPGLLKNITKKGPWAPWITMNLFIALSYFLMYRSFPTTTPAIVNQIAGYEILLAVLLNAYFIFLPLTAVNFDRCSLLVLAHLILIGNTIQFRLALINRSQIIDAKLRGDGETFANLINYVIAQYRTQVLALLIGLILLPFVYLCIKKIGLLEMTVKFCLFLTPILYLATLIVGRDPGNHGAGLWISVGGFSLQLTEFAKITYLVVLAGIFKVRPSLKQEMFFAGWAGLNFFLIMLLPDLGSVMILLPTTLVVYVIMTSQYFRATLLLLLGSGISAAAYQLFPYIRNRLYGWQTLWTEVNAGNEQIVYGLQAVARGGLWGRGLGNGSPAGIPEVFGDMVFSVLCEEWGLLVGLMVVILFLVIWLRSIFIAADSDDGFTSSMALSIATILFMEAIIVIGGSTGLIPLTGATLPFIAKGGSSILAKLIMMGMFMGLGARRNRGNVFKNGVLTL